VILSRTDSIGDVILTLPMAGLLKKNFPACKVYFLARTYTRDVVALSEHVDGFINYDELEKMPETQRVNMLRSFEADVMVHVFPKKEIALLAKKAGIGLRAGTTNRWYHWLYCNKLIRLSRKRSDLHEAQLNFKLLDFLKIDTEIALKDIQSYYGFTKGAALVLDSTFEKLIDKTKFSLILHPKSKGSAREWGLDNFEKLAELLPAGRYQLFISGTAEDGKAMETFLKNTKAIDLTGKLSLQQFIAFINACDGLVAASTGPLHIAAALGKRAVGLFAPMRPIHPGRWAPIGKRASFLAKDQDCSDCKNGKTCHCIREITPQRVKEELTKHEHGI
jgi:ADP-heptose:LPS heptosyltransferase